MFERHDPACVKTHEDHISPAIGKPSVLVVVTKCVPESQTNINTIHCYPRVIQNLREKNLSAAKEDQ